MPTTPTYEAASKMAVGLTSEAPAQEARRRIAGLPAAIDRAQHAYATAILSSRAVTAAAFFVTAAIAVGTHGAMALPMFGFLAVALFSTSTSRPLARYRFRTEIETAARMAKLSAPDARRLADGVFAEWEASPTSMKIAKTAERSSASSQ